MEWDFDPNPPNPPTHRDQYLFAPTDLDLTEAINNFTEGLESDPANINITVIRRGPVYWLMDKYNLFFALDQSGVSLADQGFTIPWLMFPGQVDFKSPRDGWKDAAGVERKAPPSESGQDVSKIVPGLTIQLPLLELMGRLITDLQRVGRPDLAKQLTVFYVILSSGKGLTAKQAADLQGLFDRIDAALR